MPATVETVEEEIMKGISADMDLPYSTVKDIIINGQSGFTKHVIESGGYNSVRWPLLGTFKLKHRFMLVKKHMSGMPKVYQKMYRKMIHDGKIFNFKK